MNGVESIRLLAMILCQDQSAKRQNHPKSSRQPDRSPNWTHIPEPTSLRRQTGEAMPVCASITDGQPQRDLKTSVLCLSRFLSLQIFHCEWLSMKGGQFCGHSYWQGTAERQRRSQPVWVSLAACSLLHSCLPLASRQVPDSTIDLHHNAASERWMA